MQIKSLVALLALCSVTALSPVFGQTSSAPITVTTDKTTYSDGSTIIISGTVTDQLNIPISIIIKDSSQHIVYIAQTNPNSDNTYSTQAVAGGDLWKTVGIYEIDVTYGGADKTSKTTFEFTASQQPVSSGTGNQTNPNQAIPEFGPLAGMIIVVSTTGIIIASRRFHF